MSKRAKKTLIILAFVVGLTYFAFTLVFFDPFEGSYMDDFEGSAVAIEYAVPRNVDVFAHKRGLEGDFDPFEFPVPRAWDDMKFSRRWKLFGDGPLYKSLAAQAAVDEKIDGLRDATQQVPLLDPLGDVLGRDFALFGRLEGPAWDQTEVAAVFLGSTSAKLAFESLGNGLIRSLVGVEAEVDKDASGVLAIRLQDGREIYAYRYLDLFVVGTGPLLVQESAELIRSATTGVEKSLGRSHRYYSTVSQDVAEFAGFRPMQRTEPADLANRVQVHVDLPAVLSREGPAGWVKSFLEPRGDLVRWLLARLFNPGYFQTFTLDVGFGYTLDLRGMLTFDKQRAEATESGFYDRPTFQLRETMNRVAALVPDDTYFLAAARVDMKQFLPMVLRGVGETDPDQRKVLDDLVAAIRKRRPDFRASNSDEAVRRIASFLGQDVVIALRRDTVYGSPEDPMPIIALFFNVTDRGPSYERLEAARGSPEIATGYQGFVYPISKASTYLREGEAGVAVWYNVWHFTKGSGDERWVQDVHLTGSDVRDVSFGIIDPRSKSTGPWTLALVMSARVESVEVDGKQEKYGSAYETMTDIVQLSNAGDSPAGINIVDKVLGNTRNVRPLLHAEKYEQAQEFLDGFASVAMYLDAEGLKEVLSDQAASHALDASEPDWKAERERIAGELLQGDFAGWRGKTMTLSVEKQFEWRIDQIIDDLDRRWRMEEVPKARREYEEGLAWIDLLDDVLLAARIDEASQHIELRARIRTHLAD